jgi:hypothetical protein
MIGFLNSKFNQCLIEVYLFLVIGGISIFILMSCISGAAMTMSAAS